MDNPYQAPVTEAPQENVVNLTERTIPVAPIPLDTMWCISRAWKFVTENFGMVFLAICLPLILSNILSQGLGMVAGLADGTTTTYQEFAGQRISVEQRNFGLVSLVATLVTHVIGVWIYLGVIKVTLLMVDGKKAEFGTAFSEGRKLLKTLGASILFGIACAVGFFLCIVPGVYLIVRYGYFMTAMVDKDLGVFDAFKYSSDLTQGSRWSVLGLFILLFLIGILGVLACCVGMLWTVPLTYIAVTLSYAYMHQGQQCTAPEGTPLVD